MCRKHCVQSYNVFDFLREVVSKVPDYGHSDAASADMSKRRLRIILHSFFFTLHLVLSISSVDKVALSGGVHNRKILPEEYNDSDEESRKNRMVKHYHLTLPIKIPSMLITRSFKESNVHSSSQVYFMERFSPSCLAEGFS